MSDDKVYRALVHDRYGVPADVLRIVQQPVDGLPIGDDEVLITVTKFPIHRGDLHMIRGDSNGGPSSPIDPQKLRGPGFEGVGTVLKLGSGAERAGTVKLGQRVAFFSGGARAWATHSVVPLSSVVPVPTSVSDEVAAQLLINFITASVVLNAAQNSLPDTCESPIFALQTAAGSSVNRLITQVALDRGVKPVLLVRSTQGAVALRAKQPGVPVIATEENDWKVQVKNVVGGKPLLVAMDAVGGELINDLFDVLSLGATIVSYGWLGEGVPDLSIMAPCELTITGVTMGSWAKNSAEQRAADIQIALKLAGSHPELFEVSADYPFSEFKAAIEHVTKPSKGGTVLISP